MLPFSHIKPISFATFWNNLKNINASHWYYLQIVSSTFENTNIIAIDYSITFEGYWWRVAVFFKSIQKWSFHNHKVGHWKKILATPPIESPRMRGACREPPLRLARSLWEKRKQSMQAPGAEAGLRNDITYHQAWNSGATNFIQIHGLSSHVFFLNVFFIGSTLMSISLNVIPLLVDKEW